MKFIIESIFCLCFFLCSFISVNAQDCVGSWSYTAPDAPYGYSTGTVEFVKKDALLLANVVVGDLKMNPVKVKKMNGNYILDFYLDGSDVSVTFAPKAKDHYSGTAVVDGSKIDVQLKRKLKK